MIDFKNIKGEDDLFNSLNEYISKELNITYKLAEHVFAYVFNTEYSETWDYDDLKYELTESIESLVELIKNVKNNS